MISLYQMMNKGPNFRHLRSGLESLDKTMCSKMGSGIYDFQQVPNSTGYILILASFIISHLEHDEKNRVVVIDSFNPFPWHAVFEYPGFKEEWLDTRIGSYSTDTFAELLGLFLLGEVGESKRTLVIITDFHDLIDLYRHELISSYEETLLKFHIQENSNFLAELEKSKFEGTKTKKLPDNSRLPLTRDIPSFKFHSHLDRFFNILSRFVSKNEGLCILLGVLSTKYLREESRPLSSGGFNNSQITTQSASQSLNSANLHSTQDIDGPLARGSVVLWPSLKEATPNVNTQYGSGSPRGLGKYQIDNYITTRVILYNEWMYKALGESHPDDDQIFSIWTEEDKLQRVYALKVLNLQEPASREKVIYYKYESNATDKEEVGRLKKLKDLTSATNVFTSSQENTVGNAIQSQAQGYPSSEIFHQANIQRGDDSSPRFDLPPSSPNLIVPQGEASQPPNENRLASGKEQANKSSTDRESAISYDSDNFDSDISAIEASDDELMGTLLVNINH
ncbi:Piso0_005172 [Millerozyma farinosa CBS 7064]|uniref:Piso0_005172 protein n=1 Tax=Pichia sorbitophila (strain ATCC MYA-4447 / BCRC 22081 / CBS 7064 / NBRC 10061 / NRRL Y-12695) TaxID=559304 RepID=G8Y4E7_PICSO|nr:Piso0_005172 [Millerozyma farinosa CBS 7064]